MSKPDKHTIILASHLTKNTKRPAKKSPALPGCLLTSPKRGLSKTARYRAAGQRLLNRYINGLSNFAVINTPVCSSRTPAACAFLLLRSVIYNTKHPTACSTLRRFLKNITALRLLQSPLTVTNPCYSTPCQWLPRRFWRICETWPPAAMTKWQREKPPKAGRCNNGLVEKCI